jgi:hypothetical protein
LVASLAIYAADDGKPRRQVITNWLRERGAQLERRDYGQRYRARL